MQYTCEDPNKLCKVECQGHDACHLSVVSYASTEIVCNGYNACYDMDITVVGDDSNDVYVNITCETRESCNAVTVNLQGSGTNNAFSLFCAAGAPGSYDWSCQNVDVNCNFANAQCAVECEGGTLASCCHGTNTLNCLTNGVGSTCDNLTPGDFGFEYGITYIPTSSPTQPSSSPTDLPTTTPTSAPTLSPSAAPSNAPSFPPSSAPTFSPTASPSSAPSFSPSGSPSQPPTAAPSHAPSIPPTDSPTTASPTAAMTQERDVYNVTLISDDLHCQQMTEIMTMLYDVVHTPIVLNVTTECEDNEVDTAPVSSLLSVPSDTLMSNETLIEVILDGIIDDVYVNDTDVDVDVVVRRVYPISIPNSTPILISTQSTEDDTFLQLLDLEWWIAIGVGVIVIVCLLVVCLTRKRSSTTVYKGDTTINTNSINNQGATFVSMGSIHQAISQEHTPKTVASNSNKKEDEEKASVAIAQPDADTIVVRNALVLSVGVSEYKNMNTMPGVARDIENYRDLWKNVYNYRVIPDEDDYDKRKWFGKKYWTFEEIEEFINEKRKELFDRNDKLVYDALIITINGHGSKDGILPSDYDKNDDDNDLPVSYDYLQLQTGPRWKPALGEIPRIFILDACRVYVDAAGGQSKALDARDGASEVHKDTLACMWYGNSPGGKVREQAAKGGIFSQCVIDELMKTKGAANSPALSTISSRVSKSLVKLSQQEQTCWLEGDPQCNGVVLVRNESMTVERGDNQVRGDNDNQVLSAETIIVDPNTIPEHEHAHRPKLSERKAGNKADGDNDNDVKFAVSQSQSWASDGQDEADELMYDPGLKVESERTSQGLQPCGDDDVKLDVSQYEAWSSEEVVRWIVSLNYEAHKQYAVRLRAAFVADIVNGRALIGISDEYLKECGVSIVH
eukprot:CAMPEP_0202727720 /NCGR_PEP_ID=MMETSP1385-20130828/185264_1 /ASSEMBLY_ACC=CAM_ASM_000861 /TAXON_ID=933848 /ORGANISM="Elphidium margaritaceum" /LENGTH=903 /DNA_ID=CAMNT_0049393963 /DNA_START=153 /DNA_END=2861 /DNA_ORIENTATION=-